MSDMATGQIMDMQQQVFPPGAPLPPGAFLGGPPTGLIGAEQALQGGAEAALSGLMGGYSQAQDVLTGPGTGYNMNGISGAIGQGVNALQPFAQAGGQAINLQAALAGALGAPAQKQAYANFQESPGQQYLREQSERALLRNQAAIGGLGGGRVRQELQRQAQGLAAQDFDASFARLGGLSTMGLGAAGQQGQLYGQQAGIQGNLEGQTMANENARRLALANIASGTGTNVGELAMRTGEGVAAGRTLAGRDMATSIGSAISALSNLANTGGKDLSATIGEGAGNLANIIAAAGAGQAGSQTSLAGVLAQILQSQGNQTGGLPGVPGVQQNNGILANAGNFLSGVGALIPPKPAPVVS